MCTRDPAKYTEVDSEAIAEESVDELMSINSKEFSVVTLVHVHDVTSIKATLQSAGEFRLSAKDFTGDKLMVGQYESLVQRGDDARIVVDWN